MKFLMAIIFTLVFSTAFGQGRAPAVEDFVGVETEGYMPTPEGTEVAFNFNFENATPVTAEPSVFGFEVIVLISFATLPFLIWFALNQAGREEERRETIVQNYNNVEFLKVYQEEKKKLEEEETKKAS